MRLFGMMMVVHSLIAMRSITASVAPLRDLRMMNRTATTKNAQAVFTADKVTMV